MTNKFDRIHTNTNKKYTVQNCPSYTLKGGYYDCWVNQDTWCENITDCVLKQIVELCRKVPILDASWILDKLDIQEVE